MVDFPFSLLVFRGLHSHVFRDRQGGLLANDEEETIEDFQEAMKIPYSAARRQ